MIERIWEGRTVCCIASGPSLTEEDCAAVRDSGVPTVAVNSSWRMAPFATVVYAGDKEYWDEYGSEISIAAERWTCRREASVKHGINWHAAYGPYNSGSRAIQFAMERGAAKIVLIGYDCSLKYGSHWHGDHERVRNPTDYSTRRWPQQFAVVAAQAKSRGVEIVNCSRDTELRVFVRGNLREELGKRPARAILVDGMFGLGDSIYQRAFLKSLPGAYVLTPWPELYSDMDMRPVRSPTRLRTQSKNVARSSVKWCAEPRSAHRIKIGYGARDLMEGSILDAMQRQFGVRPTGIDLPKFPSPLRGGSAVAIIRPVTERSEWHNPARNPLPVYVGAAARELRRRGYYVVSVADLEKGREWLVGEPPEADLVVHDGRWDVCDLLGAIQAAEIVVGGVGWIVPACIAAKTPLYVIHGGQGGHNHRSRITAPWMDLSRVGWAEPDRMCMCSSMRHDCNKEIHGFDEGFRAWLDGQGLFGVGH